MIRLSVVAILFISVFVMMQNIESSWRGKDIAVETGAKKESAPAPVYSKVALQPQVPGVLPDLKPGYLFNQDRLLEGEASNKEGDSAQDELADVNFSIQADMNEVVFSGAIIGESESVAIISFPAARKTIRSSRSSKRQRRSSKSMENARLTEGDVIDGYTVVDIFTDKIVFSKGEEQIEKYLYDPNKKRTAVSRKPSRASRGPARMAPPVPTAGKTSSRTQKTVSRTATKKMVVERKPPEKPDTSKVSRRKRVTGSQLTPAMPPFMPRQ